jgi:Fur family transcriptional regulator, ferric uptake regulator
MTVERAPARRSTRQRAAVKEVLAAADTFLTAQEIHAHLRTRGSSIGLTTVYRTLQLLAETDEVDVLQVEGEALYRRCSDSHHHHLVCRSCKVSVEIGSEGVEEWAHAVAARHGFSSASHVVEIFGLCSSCESQTS